MLSPDQLLNRLADTLRERIGPEVGEPYAKTQAYMAAVVLTRVSNQLRLAAGHAVADREDHILLVADIDRLLPPTSSVRLHTAVRTIRDDHANISILLEALYASRDELGDETFDALLKRIRKSLRSRLDRQLECAL